MSHPGNAPLLKGIRGKRRRRRLRVKLPGFSIVRPRDNLGDRDASRR